MTARALVAGVLFVDDAVPRSMLGAGHPRGLAVLRELARLATRVVVVPTQGALGADLAADPLPANVEVLDGPAEEALMRALAASPRAFDVLWVGRPNNLAWIERLARLAPRAFDGVRIVYDAEAVFALREMRRRALEGTPMSEVRERRALRDELHPAYVAAAVAAVSEAERRVIAGHVACPVHVLGMSAPPLGPGETPGGRTGALFVGNLSSAASPNGDGLAWLLREAWPVLAAHSRALTIVGHGAAVDGWLAPLAGEGVRLLGPVTHVAPHYAAARCFVAPLRYGAGIPLKVIEAAQHGVPVVATPLVADLLAWRDGVELLVAADAAAFAAAVERLAGDDASWTKVADGARAALARDYAPGRFAETVRLLVGGR